MSEFFLELFSDEIPASLQKNAKKAFLQNFKFFFKKENIGFTKCNTYSTPNRLLILFDNIKKEIIMNNNFYKFLVVRPTHQICWSCYQKFVEVVFHNHLCFAS